MMGNVNMRIVSAVACLMISLATSAQKMTVLQDVVDCGQVVYRKPVTVEYQMKNDGNHPLIIHQVVKACGCMKVEYPMRQIASGEAFVIKVVYDAKQMGTFVKPICIYSNASDTPDVLIMRGRVVEELSTFAGNYDCTLGDLKSDMQEIEFDDVNRGDRPVQRMHIFNPTNETVEPVVMHLPSYLTAQVSPSRLASHRSGEIIFVLDSKKLRDFGLTQTNVYLGNRPGDKVSSDKEITVSAVLLPNFEKEAMAERLESPKLELSDTTLNLGSFNGKKKIKGEILLTNKGNSTLDIRSLQMFTGGLRVALNKSKIKPGESAKLKVTAMASELSGSRPRKPRILMITNDPNQPKVMIRIITQK